ncbi:MAG: N-6 DNA methylase [Eggerthellales bacterium]|nr:N-6 DNA methylase [Eggerthellales bacterium]
MIRTIKRGERETHVTPAEQKRNAKEFVKRWKAAEGNEEREARSFWIELVQECLGIPQATRVLDFERKVRGRRVDVFYEDMGILIENKSRGCSLDETYIRSKKAGEETPYQQGKWYADNMPNSVRPRWILVCNFDEIRIHDLEREDPETDFVSISLEELPDHLYLLRFFTDKGGSRIERERDLSVQAGELVGRLYSQLYGQYKHIDTDVREQRSLNVLIVRLVFLLYAEDSGLLHKKDALLEYLRPFAASQMRQAVIDLFKVLDTPEDARDEYVSEELNAFPYVNGGLFAQEDIIIPQFTEQIRLDLLLEASQSFDWSGISPVIFGAAFESTLNPETRRSGGMHYTSVENIHKVIDPLFLDDLKAELAQIEGEKVEKNRKIRLKAFQRKLSSIKIFDPACGSGNFLTESYLSLRRLENRVLEDLQGDQVGIAFDEASSPICVGIDQFFGIEINDFAVSVAKTALWIAEEQMMEATQEILLQPFDFLPLKSNDNIHEGNALRMDWNGVLPAEECTYIVGNPPFYGAKYQSAEQRADLFEVFHGSKNCGTVDYVSGWYIKAAEYMSERTRAAFVSTNSICQGEQVANVWAPMYETGVEIDFAHDTFRWRNEANDQAHVFVIIVGFSKGGASEKTLFHHENPDEEGVAQVVPTINAYLSSAPNVFVWNRKKPICSVPDIGIGNKPIDGGFYIFTDQERDEFLRREPEAAKYMHPFLGSREFINGGPRSILYLAPATEEELDELPLCRERIEQVRRFRLSSSSKPTQKLAERPRNYHVENMPEGFSVLVPKVSSERRNYVPMGFIDPDVFCSDLVFLIPNATLYHFGILTSQFHNAWMRTVCGRLESRYRYSGGVVYNNFIWPGVTPETLGVPVEEAVPEGIRRRIEDCAQAVLDAREEHPGKSLADLYDPDKMPSDLLAAHKALDAAVEAAYGVDFGGDEEKIVAHLFKLYAQITQG